MLTYKFRFSNMFDHRGIYRKWECVRVRVWEYKWKMKNINNTLLTTHVCFDFNPSKSASKIHEFMTVRVCCRHKMANNHNIHEFCQKSPTSNHSRTHVQCGKFYAQCGLMALERLSRWMGRARALRENLSPIRDAINANGILPYIFLASKLTLFSFSHMHASHPLLFQPLSLF